jgi:hypothetical protein
MVLENQIAFKNEQSALKMAQLLINENYVVMLSKEEELTIVNFEWVISSDRNDVIFITRENFEEEYL